MTVFLLTLALLTADGTTTSVTAAFDTMENCQQTAGFLVENINDPANGVYAVANCVEDTVKSSDAVAPEGDA